MKPQIIRTDAGDLVVLSLAEYERLRGATGDLEERSRLATEAGSVDTDLFDSTRFRSRLEFWRKKRGFSQAKLAELCGIEAPYVNKLEKGQRDGRLLRWQAMAKALGVPLSEIVPPFDG